MASDPEILQRRDRFVSLIAAVGAGHAGRRKAATVAAAALALAVGYHIVFGANGLTAFERKRQETHRLQQEMLDLQRQNDLLQSHVQRLQTDPEAIEHQAREELRYTRPGEIIYTLPDK
jgi:cell division protein FtsB